MNPGDVVASRFEIESLAGTGGMGAVYRAIDRVGREPVALKTLKTSDEQSMERFLREAQVLAKLSHPGIVRYVTHGRTALGELFLAMEWLDGESLSQRLAREGLLLEETLSFGLCVAEALSVAHKRGIVHRDIKPNNLFLVGGNPKTRKRLFGLMSR